MNNEEVAKKIKQVRILLGIRAVLWVIAASATAYWIRYSFQLYEMGFENEHDYAAMFRPVFAKALLISVVAVVISFIVRSFSDKIKKSYKLHEEN